MVRLRTSVIFLAYALAVGVTASALAPQSAAAISKAEWNKGHQSYMNIPPPEGVPCVSQRVTRAGVHSVTASVACFDKRYDKIWVKDPFKDGRSAIAVWSLDGALQRFGACRNSFGAGTWAYCDKRFSYYSSHRFYWRAARSEGARHILPGQSARRRVWTVTR